MAASLNYWEPIQAKLSQEHQVISFDLLGFADSPRPNIRYDYNDHRQAIKRSLKEAAIKPPFILVGHSMGALIALDYAAYNPKAVSALILLGLPLYPSAKSAKYGITEGKLSKRLLYYGLSSRIICRLTCQNRIIGPWLAAKLFSHFPPAVAQDVIKHSWKSFRGNRTNIIEKQQSLKHLASISVPTLLLYGENDRFNSRQHLSNAQVKTKIIKHADHNRVVFKQPEVIINSINNFTPPPDN